MIAYVDNDLVFGGALRAHPWTASEADSSWRYINFIDHPDLIESQLEDFKSQREATHAQAFYDLIRTLNANDGSLETNDCGFHGPHAHADRNSTKSLVATSRLCVLFRANPYNVVESACVWLRDSYLSLLRQIDPQYAASEAVVGLTLQPTAFISLPNEPDIYAGKLLMLSFWCYGDSEDEALLNFTRTSKNVRQVSQAISDHIAKTFDHAAIMQDFAKQKASFVLLPENELR